MAQGPVVACSHCATEIADEMQRTCPRCLRPLRVKRFATAGQLASFRADALTHGRATTAPRTGARPAMVVAFTVAAAVMLMAVAGMLYTSVMAAGASSIQLAASAVVPLGIALGLLEVARRYRRAEP